MFVYVKNTNLTMLIYPLASEEKRLKVLNFCSKHISLFLHPTLPLSLSNSNMIKTLTKTEYCGLKGINNSAVTKQEFVRHFGWNLWFLLLRIVTQI